MEATEFQTPGQYIRALLDERGWTQRVLAVVLGTSEQALNPLINGKRDLRPEMAIRLGAVFGIDPQRFMDLQARYDLAQARMLFPAPDAGLARRAALFADLPIAQMIERRWIDATDLHDVPAVEKGLAKFFGVASPDEIEILPHAAKRTQFSGGAQPPAPQVAWIYRVRKIAREMLVPRFTPGGASRAVARLKVLLSAPELAQKTPLILAESGIRFVVVESLRGASIDGVCLWLDDASPVIGMSMRHDRIDNFWFVLRHELEHVARGHGRSGPMLDVELEGAKAGSGPDVPEDERVANEAAADFCVPKPKMDQLIARKAPFFAERDIIGFARTLKVHPGLVAGQLQHRTGRHDRFRQHQVKIRSVVVPSAYHDGWGDVHPIET